jgi:glycosyltransferase involved in cell wall biosynthesis
MGESTMTRRRIAVYDLYWSTMGGGEQVDGTLAQVLAEHHDVTVLGPQPPDVEALRRRLGVDLSRCDFRRVADDDEASAASADFDVFINGTYLSTAINQAPEGWYYVHFPGTVPTSRDRVRARVADVAAHRLAPLEGRLARVRTSFERRRPRTAHLPTYGRYLANSHYTARWVEQLWQVPCEVLYPPVRVTAASPVSGKQPTILVLGRFFDPRYGHSKKQQELFDVFSQLRRRRQLEGWRLVMVGGADAANRDYVLELKRRVRAQPAGVQVELQVNASGTTVQRLLGEASLLWHGAGLGEETDRHPERFEHFGIAVVEAMAAGAVPVVFGAAGPAEIVRHGVDGLHWSSPDELARHSVELVADPVRRAALADSARRRALDFSVDVFASRVRSFINTPGVAAPGLP